MIVTGDVLLADVGRRDEPRTAFGATPVKAVKMDVAAVVQTCRQFAVPCLVARSVSGKADGRLVSPGAPRAWGNRCSGTAEYRDNEEADCRLLLWTPKHTKT